MSQTIKPESAVSLKYSMKTHFMDGTVQERPDEVINFIFGIERQVPSLEGALSNAQVGSTFSVRIPADELYGEHDPELIKEIPKKGLIKQRIKPGQYYRQIKKGALVTFKVLEIREKTVLADLNPPMAGIHVTMEAEVLKVREASKKEIEAAVEAETKRRIGCG
jgi:FKBP-type peptidyl-prolyl cis-trans isomerase SlyD